ncbi:YhdT family protein [Massilibacterium senegalense]|uniref:YhdT family protein n=1 Tax=Massilibacterium senegalense TaxID=1632858 RepID=UPI0007846343|nr:YhdT family protein [Massilibacterium senegalense]
MEKEKRIDPRYKVANKEAMIGIVLAIANFVWWYGFGYGLGERKVEDYTYIFGLPDWFFYSCVVGFIVFSFIVTVVVKLFFKEVPFEEGGDKK